MKTYLTTEHGYLTHAGTTIPEGHRFYTQALQEVEDGEAEILPYVAPPVDPNAQIDADINAIEASITPRRVRDAILTDLGAEWLTGMESEIQALRENRS